MERIEVVHVFAAELGEGFRAITDMANWAKYFPGLVRIEDRANARWREPGDEVTVVLTLLGRERAMHMELDRFQVAKPHGEQRRRHVSRQPCS